MAKQPTHVFLIAPSSPIEEPLLQKAESLLKSHGFKVDYQPNILDQHFLFAGTCKRRQGELTSQLTSKDTHVIWCARGGTGSHELLSEIVPLLPRVQALPKYFIGFSDATPLQNWLALKTSMRVLYGLAAAIPDFEAMPASCWSWLKTLLHHDEGKWDVPYQFFRGKQLEGQVVGGNLSMLLSLLGTPYDFSYDGKILFVEDVNEPFHRVARGLWQLHQSGKLQKLTGMVFGKFNIRSCIEEDLYLYPLLEYFFAKSAFPIIFNFPCGHIPNCVALPLNTPVRFEAGRLSFTWDG